MELTGNNSRRWQMNQQHMDTQISLSYFDRAVRFILGTVVMLLVLQGIPADNGSVFALTTVHIYLIMTGMIGIDPVYSLMALFRKQVGSLIIARPQGQQA